jgi:hypothetical protein
MASWTVPNGECGRVFALAWQCCWALSIQLNNEANGPLVY